MDAVSAGVLRTMSRTLPAVVDQLCQAADCDDDGSCAETGAGGTAKGDHDGDLSAGRGT